MIQVETICDSIGPTSDYTRLFTIKAKAPKFIHQETLRHRTIYIEDLLGSDPDFSFSVSSARAIPFKNLLAEVRSDELRAEPEFWGAEQKGMSPGEELSDINELQSNGGYYKPKNYAKQIWREAAWKASLKAEQLAAIGVHKSIVNRIIEPYIHAHCLMTATTPGWMNFFGLRLDKAADPTVKALAEAVWKEWNESKPQVLRPGEWHLPFVNLQTDIEAIVYTREINTTNTLLKISAARCARLSYLSFETQKRSTIEEDLALYNRLAGSLPIHASPMEHQATPDEYSLSCHSDDTLTKPTKKIIKYKNPEQSGNLGLGWRQYRKMLAGERVAPLPKDYENAPS